MVPPDPENDCARGRRESHQPAVQRRRLPIGAARGWPAPAAAVIDSASHWLTRALLPLLAEEPAIARHFAMIPEDQYPDCASQGCAKKFLSPPAASFCSSAPDFDFLARCGLPDAACKGCSDGGSHDG